MGSPRVRRSAWTAETGGAVVEFAMIGVTFFLLVGLVIQGAFIFSAWLIITNAVREGARAGAPCYDRPVEPCTAAQIESYVRRMAQGVNRGRLVVDVTTQEDAPNNQKLLVVQAEYSVPIVAPLVGAFLPNPIPMNAQSLMRLENG